MIFLDIDQTIEVKPNLLTNQSDPSFDSLSFIKITLPNEIKITDIDFFEISDVFSMVGGISSMINAMILVIVKYLVYKNWEQDVFNSIFGFSNNKINKTKWDDLT